MKRAWVLVAPAALAACATVPVDQGRAVSARVEAAMGAPAPWPRTAAAAADQRAMVARLLADPLTPETAARIALAQNPRVIAAFEDLGVARADFLQAVLPPNPSVSLARLTGADGEPPKLGASVAIDVIDALATPLRARAGRAGRDAAIARVTADVLGIAGEARAATIAAIAARQDADLMAQAADAADAAADVADALYATGNIAAVDRDRERLFAEEIGLQRDLAQAASRVARERVNAALGLDGEAAGAWTAAARLPPAPTQPIDLLALETRARATSLDLAIAAGAVEASRADATKGWLSSILPGLEVGLERERDGGVWKRGPSLGLALPVFDLGARERLRLASIARRQQAVSQALSIEIAAEARALGVAAEAARAAAVRRREIVAPLSADVFEGAQRDFGAMQIGLAQLLEAKRRRLEDGRALVAATRDFWLAQGRLDLLLAGVRGAVVTPQSEAAPPPQGKGH